MKSEFALAFNEVVEDRQLSRDVILEALESALVSAYRKAVNASNAQFVEAKVDMDQGEVSIFAEKETVEDVQDERTEVLLSEARKVDPDAVLGDMVVVETTPENFGRVAAQTARQVIQQRIREAEREIQLDYFEKQVGEIVSGIVQAVTPRYATIGLDKKAEGQMLRKDMIPRERLRVHDRIRCLIYEVTDSNRGPQILLSRAHRNFLRRLLENEVPEIYHGVVEIRSIAREPGQRAKAAVSATQQGIDPVGACVGVRGVRIQAIVRELSDEKIDVIEWSNDAAAFIAKAISPARVVGVYLAESEEEGKTATVVVPEDQLSLAIGRDGQNARLAAKLTGWRIDIKSQVEAAADALVKLKEDPNYAEMAEREAEAQEKVAIMLEKKAEGRPLPPEDYDYMAKFINRVEKRVEEKLREENLEEKLRYEAALATVPDLTFEINILDVDLQEHILYILQEVGIETLGDLVLQIRIDPDRILGLNGIGPKTFEKIQALTDGLRATPEEVHPEEVLLSEEDSATEAAPETETSEETLEPDVIEVEDAAMEAQAPAEAVVLEPAAPETSETTEEGEAEVDEFEKLFSYDAAKYGYFEPEKAIFDDGEEEIKPAKKKKRKKPRPAVDDSDLWDEW
ncbi:MAG: transcription termination/antitermination protein NusA [Chloroflexi bacterium]|jgi:N utilization substance protein A|nr:transcription termination/antitermination protein NusA [Chloroflexota bacterium]